jgi:hypothetical protein
MRQQQPLTQWAGPLLQLCLAVMTDGGARERLTERPNLKAAATGSAGSKRLRTQ